MRKSFEGLSLLVDSLFPGKLLTGSLFLFLNRRRDMIKILYWEPIRAFGLVSSPCSTAKDKF